MIVPTMSVPEMVADARKDFRALRNKLDEPLRRTRREHIKTKQEILHLLPWRSRNGNRWLLMVHQLKTGPRIYCLAWYYDHAGRINALWTAHSGLAYHISWHVIDRYGQRFDPTASPLERLQSFFLENYMYTVDVNEVESEDRCSVSVGMNHGMGLGFWCRNEHVVYINTFVNHGQLFPEQEDAMERMDFERLLLRMSLGQRRALIALYKRTYPQHAGTPGMDWLERFAA